MCGWSERGVEDGWRVDRNALVSWAWHLREVLTTRGIPA